MSPFRRKNKRPFKLTKAGWVFVLYTIGVGAGAINTGNNLLYLIFGIFLGVILASGVLSDLSLWKISVEPFLPRSVQAGEANLISFRLQNRKKRLPSLSLTVELEGTLRGERVLLKRYVPAVFAGEDTMSHFVFIPPRRGVFEAKSLRLSTRFPFGLLLKWWSLPAIAESVFVYPRPLYLSDRDASSQAAGEKTASVSPRKGDGSTLTSIRDYRETDNPKRIHWKASAKRFGLDSAAASRWLVREMEADEKDERLVVWPDAGLFSAMEEADAEQFLQFSAALVRAIHENGGALRLIVPLSQNYYEVDPVHGWETIMEFHSVFEPTRPDQPESLRYLCAADVNLNQVRRKEVEIIHAYRQWKA